MPSLNFIRLFNWYSLDFNSMCNLDLVNFNFTEFIAAIDFRIRYVMEIQEIDFKFDLRVIVIVDTVGFNYLKRKY